jgi:hypothetical protein
MGVQYAPCAYCKKTICDDGEYDTCQGCGAHYCESCRGDGIGIIVRFDDEGFDDCAECIKCTTDYAVKEISDAELIQFLLPSSPYKTVAEAQSALRSRHLTK